MVEHHHDNYQASQLIYDLKGSPIDGVEMGSAGGSGSASTVAAITRVLAKPASSEPFGEDVSVRVMNLS
jgi:hypothetical protein